MLLYLVQFMGGRGRGEERRTKPVKKNRDPRWEEEFQFTLDEPPTNDRIHVEVVSTSSRMGLLHPKLLPSSELLWITLTTLTVVHFGCVITLAARLFTSAARHPARLLDILLGCSGDMKGSASGGDRSSKRDIVGAQIDPNALVAHQQSFTQGMNYLNSEV